MNPNCTKCVSKLGQQLHLQLHASVAGCSCSRSRAILYSVSLVATPPLKTTSRIVALIPHYQPGGVLFCSGFPPQRQSSVGMNVAFSTIAPGKIDFTLSPSLRLHCAVWGRGRSPPTQEVIRLRNRV